MTPRIDSSGDMTSLVSKLNDLHLNLEGVPPYLYQHLKHPDSFRLIRLEPNKSHSQPLRCKLLEVRLSDHPDYESISYAWGPLEFSSTLAISDSYKKITESLALALRKFRGRDNPRLLWADAVCINQEDVVEKGSQVEMMGNIFRQSRWVLVWLGPGDDRTAHIFNLLKHLCSVAEDYGIHRNRITVNDFLVKETWDESEPILPAHKKLLDSISSDYDFLGMDEFYSQPWFTRKWVIQETALARDIQLHCGQCSIAWEDFITAARIQYRSVKRATLKNLRLPYGFQYAKQIEYARARYICQQHYNLLNHLKQSRGSKCSNDLDHVYALLSMRGPKDISFRPDYTLSVSEAYTNLARAMLETKVHISLLSYAGIAHRLTGANTGNHNIVHDMNQMPSLSQICKELPSWVPDWRIAMEYRSLEAGKFGAAIDTPETIYTDPSKPVIRVKGMFIDIITGGRNLGTQRTMDMEQFRQRVLLIKEFYDRSQQHLNYAAGEDALTRFARTITADGNEPTAKEWLRNPEKEKELVDLWNEFQSKPFQALGRQFETTGAAPEKAFSGGEVYNLSELYGYRVLLRRTLNDRQFIVTSEGRVGLAPAIAQRLDRIALFAGSSVPFVVRAAEDSTKEHTIYYIIGDCFLHGVMYGEFAKQFDNDLNDYNDFWQPITLV